LRVWRQLSVLLLWEPSPLLLPPALLLWRLFCGWRSHADVPVHGGG
jgi:hypothetical protein